jgi:hypothetical protein
VRDRSPLSNQGIINLAKFYQAIDDLEHQGMMTYLKQQDVMMCTGLKVHSPEIGNFCSGRLLCFKYNGLGFELKPTNAIPQPFIYNLKTIMI